MQSAMLLFAQLGIGFNIIIRSTIFTTPLFLTWLLLQSIHGKYIDTHESHPAENSNADSIVCWRL